jgi:hypothetical protein
VNEVGAMIIDNGDDSWYEVQYAEYVVCSVG